MIAKSFVGIDPGKSGALAVVSDFIGNFAIPFDQKEYIATLNNLKSEGSVFVIVEHVGAMPKQGVSSTFKFGENFGWIQGALSAIGIPYELVRPQKWKKMFSCTSDKNTSIEVATRLFPDVSLLATERCKKPHDGMAEALLMAEYGRRISV